MNEYQEQIKEFVDLFLTRFPDYNYERSKQRLEYLSGLMVCLHCGDLVEATCYCSRED